MADTPGPSNLTATAEAVTVTTIEEVVRPVSLEVVVVLLIFFIPVLWGFCSSLVSRPANLFVINRFVENVFMSGLLG